MTDHIYSRQSSLSLTPPRFAAIIGCGGVGSWLALDLALIGVGKLVLVDDDVVEPSNLNRTPYTVEHAERRMPKALALALLIWERRPEYQAAHIHKKAHELDDELVDLVARCDVVFDCRDTLTPPLPEPIAEKAVVKAGYDGFSATLHFHPRPESVWSVGDEDDDEPTPSFVVPPQLEAALLTLMACTDAVPDEQRVCTFDVRSLLEEYV